METIAPRFNVGFMKWRHAWSALSLALVAASAFIWFQAGDSKYGVDFLGGTVIQVQYETGIEPSKIRGALDQAGLTGSVVQAFGTEQKEFSIRVPSGTDRGPEAGAKARAALGTIENSKFEVLQEDFVGPVIGEQIKKDAVKAVIIAFIGIMIYVSVRFHWTYALGGLVALVHDTAVMTGVVVLSGREFDATILAAVLTIIGYSINDTIVLFDRIRENLSLALKTGGDKGLKRVQSLREMNLVQLMELSVNETLSRTILTSLTVLFVSVCLWQFGGGAVANMAFALTIGCIVGTYSTIYVACAVVLLFQQNSKVPLKDLKTAPGAR